VEECGVGLIGSVVVGRGFKDVRMVDLRSTLDFEVW
jgi:hypothetical protein